MPKVAHLIVDMQYMCVRELPDQTMVGRLEAFVDATQHRFAPIYIRTVHDEIYSDENWDKLSRGEKTDYCLAINKLPAAASVDKTQSSAFIRTDLPRILAKQDIDTVVISGMHRRCCVWLTALSAAEAGYRVIVIDDLAADGHSFLRSPSEHYPAITRDYAEGHGVELVASGELNRVLGFKPLVGASPTQTAPFPAAAMRPSGP